VPKKRGGRKRLIDTQPQLQPNLEHVLHDHTAGDPMKPDVLWTNLSLNALAQRMADLGSPASPYIVQQLLDHLRLGRRQVFKTLAMGPTRNRNDQFETIAFYREVYLDSPNPIVSIDTKKRELLGIFHRDGHLWTQATCRVFDHDYPSFADGYVIPHGIYDLKRNRGYINLGISHDTSAFACDSLFHWWTAEGHREYPRANSLLLLCDGGGSNGCRQYLFKQELQGLANRIGLEIRVAHYPPYTSKYNPIEHRLFPHVTRACQGVIFTSVEQVQHYMTKTATRTGLSVTVNILNQIYETGKKVAEGFKKTMRIVFDAVLPRLNYRAIPQSK
jgi:hypothetical protein